MSIKSYIQYDVSTESGRAVSVAFKEVNKPNIFQIRNKTADVIYVGLKSITDQNNYEMSIISGGTRVLTIPAAKVDQLYIYCAVNGSVTINTAYSDELYPSDLDQTQISVIQNFNVGASVEVTKINQKLPAGDNTIGKVDVNDLSTLISLLQDIKAELISHSTKIDAVNAELDAHTVLLNDIKTNTTPA